MDDSQQRRRPPLVTYLFIAYRPRANSTSSVVSAKMNTATGPTYASNSELYMTCPTEHMVCWTSVLHAYRLCVTCHVTARLLQLA